jgi:hypothetical protein
LQDETAAFIGEATAVDGLEMALYMLRTALPLGWSFEEYFNAIMAREWC